MFNPKEFSKDVEKLFDEMEKIKDNKQNPKKVFADGFSEIFVKHLQTLEVIVNPGQAINPSTLTTTSPGTGIIK